MKNANASKFVHYFEKLSKNSQNLQCEFLKEKIFFKWRFQPSTDDMKAATLLKK